MNTEHKANYLRIALALQGVVCKPEMAYRIMRSLELIEEKGGDTDLKDVSELEVEMQEYEAKKALEQRKKDYQP